MCHQLLAMTKLFTQTNGGNMERTEKTWGELYGDTYPTDKELPIEVIEHHAQAHGLIASDDLLMFARALWTEGKLS
jgi:hypothetical protein